MKLEDLIKILQETKDTYLKKLHIKKITIVKGESMYAIEVDYIEPNTPDTMIFKKIDDIEVIDFEEEK